MRQKPALSFGRRWSTAVLFASLILTARAAAPELSVERGADGRPRLSAAAGEDEVVTLERSSDLGSWEPWRVGHGPLRGVADLTAGPPGRFYRGSVRPIGEEDDWKNLVRSDFSEPFLSEMPSMEQPRWIKFLILLDDPERVVFQDSMQYRFHYDFARVRVERFRNMTRDEFDAVTLHTNAQQAVLGAVLFSPSGRGEEAAIQFVGADPYPREAVAEWFRTVRASILSEGPMEVFYLPTFEQADVARQHRDWFEEQGISVGSAGRWVVGDECYSPGWAVGRMVFVPADQIEPAYAEGRLGPDDVLLTDAVPAEVPPLAGIIAMTPATPNSHVALLARSFGIPFVHMPELDEDTLRSWDGRHVLLRAVEQLGTCKAMLAPLAGTPDEEILEGILEEKRPPQLDIPPKQAHGSLSVGVEDLGPDDIVIVGGKAANMGVLRRSIPTNSPSPVIAFTFDLWDEYVSQTLDDGRTLAETVEDRLGGFTWPPDMAGLTAALDDIRDLFRNGSDFNPAQREAILTILQDAGFDPMRKIRFRSSTNVEDSEQFSGAGLYDSYSGCLADDLDEDSAGPSHCDPTEENERGVFRALRRVFASFYNDNAFLERLRHGVDESRVGMAVLVHHSTPDEIELANGVATLEVRREGAQRVVEGTLVTQLGAESVANPDLSVSPEIVQVRQFDVNAQPLLDVDQHSSLVQLGATVLEWPDEYAELFRLLNLAARQWESELPPKDEWLLDFEYKKVAPEGVLRIKQIRALPLPAFEIPETRWLLGSTNRWVVDQGEHGELLSYHRLKSSWFLETRHAALDPEALGSTLFTGFDGRWLEGTNVVAHSEAITALPGYEFEFDAENSMTIDRWTDADGTHELRVDLVRFPMPHDGPAAVLGDFKVAYRVRHTEPQPTLERGDLGGIQGGTTHEDVVSLVPARPVTSQSLLQERVISRGSREVRTRFYWPPPPRGIVVGYTAPLQEWVETTVEGFTSRPLVLRGEYSQTYHPGHHNFWEDFLFDPWLEPGIDADLLEECREANIRAVIVGTGESGMVTMAILGLDGVIRPVED